MILSLTFGTNTKLHFNYRTSLGTAAVQVQDLSPNIHSPGKPHSSQASGEHVAQRSGASQIDVNPPSWSFISFIN